MSMATKPSTLTVGALIIARAAVAASAHDEPNAAGEKVLTEQAQANGS